VSSAGGTLLFVPFALFVVMRIFAGWAKSRVHAGFSYPSSAAASVSVSVLGFRFHYRDRDLDRDRPRNRPRNRELSRSRADRSPVATGRGIVRLRARSLADAAGVSMHGSGKIRSRAESGVRKRTCVQDWPNSAGAEFSYPSSAATSVFRFGFPFRFSVFGFAIGIGIVIECHSFKAPFDDYAGEFSERWMGRAACPRRPHVIV
jgi:hypothetical protein